jgi:heme exporter protein D
MMSGQAFYIWTSYILSFILLCIQGVSVLYCWHRSFKNLGDQLKENQVSQSLYRDPSFVLLVDP